MPTTLFIPIQVRQLFLDKATPVASAATDFSRAPYYDSNTRLIVNNDNPFISENMVNKPFEDGLHDLEPGNHLHFILPPPFTHLAKKGEPNLPAPNRWLVNKVDTNWIVESDFLSETPIPGQNQVTTILPVPEASNEGFTVFSNKGKDYNQPFLYMGRQRKLTDSNVDSDTSSWWEAVYGSKLTAFAYGDAQFPISYPNCHSVWGFQDEEGQEEDTYNVFAWFDYPDSDITAINTQIIEGVKTLIDNIKADASLVEPSDKTAAFFASVQELGWSFNPADFGDTIESIEDSFNINTIQQVVFYGCAFGKQAAPPVDPKVSLAIGNNGVEALSAYLAGSTYPKDKTKKNELENKLEAIQFDSLKSEQLDLGAKFVESRHAKGFKASNSGIIWDYEIDAADGTKLSPEQLALIQNIEKTNPKVSQLAEALDALNKRQEAYDHSTQSIADKQQLLFSDWYKYMLCAHPPLGHQDIYPRADEVLDYILNTRINNDLQPLMSNTGKLIVVEVPTSSSSIVSIATRKGFLTVSTSAILASDAPQNSDSAANQVLDQFGIVKQQIEDLNKGLNGDDQTLVDNKLAIYINRKPAPRYYAPIDPSLLISGPDIVPAAVKEETTPNISKIVTNALPGILRDIVNHSQISDLGSYFEWLHSFGELRLETLAWHPHTMEWEVAFYPLESTQNQAYDQGFLKSIYDLPSGQPELSPLSGDKLPQSSSAISIYRGFSHLTPYSLTYLDEKLGPYKTLSSSDSGYDEELKNAALQLDSEAVLTQALSGFNDAFLMRKHSLQLASIVDPVAMDDYKPLIQKIDQYINGNIGTAPLPNNDFNPIRGGGLNITKLNLIDSFGQKLTIYDYFKDSGQTPIYVPNTLTTEAPVNWKGFSNSIQAFFPPRFIPATRLHARWLSKDDDAIECGSHFNHSPICGWVVRNIMDDTIALYDFAGNMLGSIGLVSSGSPSIAKPQAIPKPSARQFDPQQDISNTHLKNFATFLLSLDETKFNDFYQVLTNAQEYTDPTSFAQHPELTFLMGQPMALVRICLNFEQQGEYANDEGWTAFENRLAPPHAPQTDNFENVQIPVRLGDYRQLNDGVIGFWDDGDDGSIDVNSTFYSPVVDFYAEENDAPSTLVVKTEFAQSLAEDDHYFTMLFDPRGQLNITTGVLPVKNINIPSFLYKDSLKNIKVTFEMSPILTPKDKVQFPVPKENGYQWNWIYPEDPGFASFPARATIQKDILNAQWILLDADTPDIYSLLTTTKANYDLILTPLITNSDQAYIHFNQVTKDNLQVLFTDASPDVQKVPEQLMQILLKYHQGIDAVVVDPQFVPTEIKEGWLELIEDPTYNPSTD